MNQGENQAKISPDETRELEKELLNLEIKGANLRKIMTDATTAKSNTVAYNERRFQTRNLKRSDGFISDFTNAVTGVANTVTDAANAVQNFLFG